jgi:tetratricopeptide (TPR) repeat protein
MLAWIHMDVEAASVAEAGLHKYPGNSIFINQLIYLLRVSGRADEALALSKRLTADHPDQPDHWNNTGWNYLALGEPDSAEAAFQRALDIDPDLIWRRINILVCAYFRGDVKDAIEQYREFDLTEITDASRQRILTGGFGLAQFLAERGQYKKASAILDSVLEESDWSLIYGPTVYFHFLLPSIPEKIKELRRGLEASIDELENAPGPEQAFRARWDIVEYLIALDSTEVARPYYKAWCEAVPTIFVKNSYWWKVNAQFALADGRPEDALRYYQELERTGNKHGSTFDIIRRSNIARAHRMLGRLDEAARTLEDLIELYKGHYIGWYKLGLIYDEMGRAEKATEAYKKFLDGWSEADPGLGQVDQARRRLETLSDRTQ